MKPVVPRIHIVGRKNSGKTTLVCDLVNELCSRGWNVATVKHTHHHHELDTPGKDSDRHRKAGAAGVGIISPEVTAVFLPVGRGQGEDKYRIFDSVFCERDLILVEGDLHSDAPRLEVWRAEVSDMPYAADHPGIAAVITDDPLELSMPVWKRSELSLLVAKLEQIFAPPDNPKE